MRKRISLLCLLAMACAVSNAETVFDFRSKQLVEEPNPQAPQRSVEKTGTEPALITFYDANDGVISRSYGTYSDFTFSAATDPTFSKLENPHHNQSLHQIRLPFGSAHSI